MTPDPVEIARWRALFLDATPTEEEARVLRRIFSNEDRNRNDQSAGSEVRSA